MQLDTGIKRQRTSALPVLAFADPFCEFFEPLIHQSVFLRRVYPSDLFESCMAFGVPVFRCVHPLLAKYIANAVASAKPWIEV